MSRRARVLAIALVVPAFVVCLVLLGYVKYVRVMSRVESLQQHLGNLEERGGVELLYSFEAEELKAVREELVQVGVELRGLKAELGPAVAIAPYLGWLPVIGGDVAAGADLLEVGIGISVAADLVFELSLIHI